MEEEINIPKHDPEEWLREEAQGDDELLGLLRAKEIIGEERANREIEFDKARLAFDALNRQIAQRRIELGLDAPSPDQPEE